MYKTRIIVLSRLHCYYEGDTHLHIRLVDKYMSWYTLPTGFMHVRNYRLVEWLYQYLGSIQGHKSYIQVSKAVKSSISSVFELC